MSASWVRFALSVCARSRARRKTYPDGECWREIWQLYCLQRVAILDHERLYESDFVSLPMEASH